MRRSLFLKLFPPPKYLEMRPIGLDISDQSVKYCSLKIADGGFAVELLGEEKIPAGAIESGKIKDKEVVAGVLRAVREKTGVSYATAALPEEPGYLVKMSLPLMPERDLRSSIELQLEEHVPIPISGVVFDYEIIAGPREGKSGYELAVSVYPKALILDYLYVLSDAGFVLLACEIEAHAVTRALVKPGSVESFLVVDIGKTHTGLCVVSGDRVVLTATVEGFGGDLISKAAQKGMAAGRDEVELIKSERGLFHSKDDRLLTALLPIASVLRDEINKFNQYWDLQSEESKVGAGKIARVLICGGQATLPGLVEYLGASLEVPVEIGNVWTNVMDISQKVPPLTLNESLKYATALGLVLRHFRTAGL